MKKSKYLLWIFVLICLFGCGKKEGTSNEVLEENYVNLSDKDFLISVGSFQRTDSPNVIWTFLENGSGTITLDGEDNKYDMNWLLNDDKLVITIKWVHDEKQEYEVLIDKENCKITINQEYVFVKNGSIKKSNLKWHKEDMMKGAWIIEQDKGTYMWYFDDEYCYVGYYVDKLYVIDKYTWGVIDGDLVLVSVSLKKDQYGYVISEDNLVLYRKNEIIKNFSRYDGKIEIN